jgi:4-carboxymuconolactone decarboxylase
MKHLFAIACVATAFAVPQPVAAQDSGRFPALRADQLSPAQKKWADSIARPPRNANFANFPYRAYVRSPDLANHLTNLSDYVRWNTELPARLTEFAILIAARQWNSPWIWRGHYTLALKGGLEGKVALDLAAGKRPEGMKEDESALYDFAMEFYRDKSVSDAAYNAAVAKFGERGLLDLIGTMGYYGIVAMTLHAGRAVPPDDGTPQLKPLTP